MIRQLHTSAARCTLGVGRADITPPGDAYHRNWGAALHDRAEGVHRPLTATAVALAGARNAGGGAAVGLFALDLGWLREAEMACLLDTLRAGTGLGADGIVVTFSHTHAAINLDAERAGEPGGEHIGPYLEGLPRRLLEAWEEARKSMTTVDLVFGAGRCALAMHRDAHDEGQDLRVCGPNPEGPADDTLLVARATDADGRCLATLVNYACHPTTLAWDNRLISPDYVGALRQTVEATTGASCVFLQGAAGDLGPVRGFVGDTTTADSNGRQLGHAVLATLETLPPPGRVWAYTGPVVSGATLGVWGWRDVEPERRAAQSLFAARTLSLRLPLRRLPARAELEADLAAWSQRLDAAARDGAQDDRREARARIERLRRALRRVEAAPADGAVEYDIHLWRLGEAVLIAVGGEPYQQLQVGLRRRFPGTALLVVELCNRPHSYLLPRQAYGLGLYQDEVCVLTPGSLEAIEDAVAGALADWRLS